MPSHGNQLDKLVRQVATMFHEALEAVAIDCGVTLENAHEFHLEDHAMDDDGLRTLRLIRADMVVARVWVELGTHWVKISYHVNRPPETR